MKLRSAIAAIVLTLCPAIASAATATTTFAVTATVLSVCTVAALPLPFGNYDPTSASPTDSTSTITVLCTSGAPYNVRLNQGTNGSSVTARKMIRASGTELLSYSLYRNAGHTQNWGETDATDTNDSTAIGIAQVFTVYGRIAAGATVPAGVYSDTVTVTVNY